MSIRSQAGQSLFVCLPVFVDEDGEDVDAYKLGEIIIAGNTAIGYWNKPEETASRFRNGFVYTGDMGHYDAEMQDEGFTIASDKLGEREKP